MICPNCHGEMSNPKDKHLVSGANLCFVTLYQGNKVNTIMIGHGRRRNDTRSDNSECKTNESGGGNTQETIPEFDRSRNG